MSDVYVYTYVCLSHTIYLSRESRQNETSAPEAQFSCQCGFPRDKRESPVTSVRQKFLSSIDPTCPAPNCNPKNPSKRQAHSRRQRTAQVEMSWKSYTNCDAVMRVIKDDLLKWTCERHSTGCLLDRHLLRDKALELAHKHGLTSTFPQNSRVT